MHSGQSLSCSGDGPPFLRRLGIDAPASRLRLVVGVGNSPACTGAATPAATAGVPELGMRSLLNHDYPAQPAEGPDDFPAGDPRQWRHGANGRRPVSHSTLSGAPAPN